MKSGCTYIELPSEIVDRSHSFFRRSAQPVFDIVLNEAWIPQAAFGCRFLDHVFCLTTLTTSENALIARCFYRRKPWFELFALVDTDGIEPVSEDSRGSSTIAEKRC